MVMGGSAARKSDEAYRRIKGLIRNGELAPGDRLTEHNLMRLVGMGRGPVRESLVRLQAERLIDSDGAHRSKRVAYLEDLDRQEVIERYQVREMLEGLAARLAAENMTGKQINALRELEQEIGECLGNSDRQRRLAKAEAFYKYLFEHCGNPVLKHIYQVEVLRPLAARDDALDEQIVARLPGCDAKTSWLAPVVAAIASHDPHAAECAARAWIQVIIATMPGADGASDDG